MIDFGCGTGFVGEELVKKGITNAANICGIDSSQGMIDLAQQKNCYGDLRHMFLGLPDKFPAELVGKFDVVTAAAVLAEGHLMSEVFDEMLMSLKPQGYAIFTTRVENLEKFGYGKAIADREEKGLWAQREVCSYNKYPNIDKGAEIGHFKQVECVCYVYQKL